MSTRSSYFLTGLNEHWFHDCSDYTNNIEIEFENIISIKHDFDNIKIEIKKDSELYTEIKKYIGFDNFIISIPYVNIENYQECKTKNENYVVIVTAACCKCNYDKRVDLSYTELKNYIVDKDKI
jgi:hypothetical protein